MHQYVRQNAQKGMQRQKTGYDQKENTQCVFWKGDHVTYAIARADNYLIYSIVCMGRCCVLYVFDCSHNSFTLPTPPHPGALHFWCQCQLHHRASLILHSFHPVYVFTCYMITWKCIHCLTYSMCLASL